MAPLVDGLVGHYEAARLKEELGEAAAGSPKQAQASRCHPSTRCRSAPNDLNVSASAKL